MNEERTAQIHPVDEMLPTGQLFAYGLQHVLAMYAGAVAVPIIVAQALHLSPMELVHLINADLFSCGIATLIQNFGILESRCQDSHDPRRYLCFRNSDDSHWGRTWNHCDLWGHHHCRLVYFLDCSVF